MSSIKSWDTNWRRLIGNFAIRRFQFRDESALPAARGQTYGAARPGSANYPVFLNTLLRKLEVTLRTKHFGAVMLRIAKESGTTILAVCAHPSSLRSKSA